MKKSIIGLLCILFTITLFAQTPEWQWASQAGGSNWDSGNGITIDDNGNSYVTGFFQGTATFGSYSLTSSGGCDIFVAKMDATGNWLWATQAGGSDDDYAYGIAIDNSGNSYVTGSFLDIATFGAYSISITGGVWYYSDIFVAKIDTNGNWLWANNAGGSTADYAYGIAIDDDGNSYVTGYFSYTATFGSYSLTSCGGWDIFVAKMDANGNWLWATQAGGTDVEKSYSIAIDESENSYVTGHFQGTATFGSYSLTSSGEDIFVAKMDAYGNWLWANNAGGSNHDFGYGIAIGNDGNSYVTGWFHDIATFGSYSLSSSGSEDIFVAKMDSNGNWLWATQAGGSDHDFGYEIVIDDNENSYVTGHFQGTATFGSYSLTSSGGIDIFVAKMDSNGNWLWATQAGGSDHDFGYEIAIDDNENSYVTGHFQGTATFGSYSLTSSGGVDIFIAKLGNDTSVENEIITTKMELSNYPNPFNPSTMVEFSIQNDSEVELSIFNIKGQKVKQLLNEQLSAGQHSAFWNGKDDDGKSVSSGIYFYKLKTGNYEKTKRMVLLK